MYNKNLLTVEEMCKKLKPVFGEKIDKLYLQYTLTDSREKRAEIQQALSVLFEKHLNTTLLGEKVLLSPPEIDLTGDYPLAEIEYADKSTGIFGLREKDWIRHVLISGMSGSGKTMFAFKILQKMIEKNKPFIVFDWKKSFRPLLKLDKNIMCFTVGNKRVANVFKTNINRPPQGIEPKEWINILCDLITESFFASYGVHKLIREAMDESFKAFGVYNGSDNYPTWKHIKKMLEKKESRGREAEWRESALRIAHALTFGSFGDAVNTNNIAGMNIEEIMDKKAIFELQTLNNSEKKFFCEYILSYIFFTKKANEKKKSTFKGLILVDEAHNIFLKERPNFLTESVTDSVYREMREYGFGLVCLDQHISKLSETVAGNSATNIAFQQMLPKDVDTVANLMQMYPEKKFFTMLPVGSAIVKLAERHYHPFLIKAPFIELKEEYIEDKLIKERMSKIIKVAKRIKSFKEDVKEENLINVIKKKYKIDKIKNSANTINHIQLALVGEIKQFLKSGFEPQKIKDYLKKQGYKNEDINRAMKNVSMDPKIVEETKNFINSNNTAKSVLKGVKNKPLPTTEVYKKLKLSARKGNEIKKQLLFLGLIEEVEQRDKKGWKKLIQITDKGLLAIH